ncbi:MAG: rhomboid family intramembrane serine protease [Hyphomonadaceae bacterium]|nr:rhomboid family intramembrane serine protease [Hyphomonadaceae bacterium]
MKGLPAVVVALAALIVGVYLVEAVSVGAREALFHALAVIPARFQPGPDAFHSPVEALGPVFGHALLHDAPWPLHVMMNMLIYLQIGGLLYGRFDETGGGAWRFLAFFFGSAAASAAAYILINPGSEIPAVGASGAICGMFAGYLLGARRNWRQALGDPAIRRMGFWFLFINVGLAALARITGFLPIAWEAHLGGFVGGVLLFPFLAPRRAAFAGPWG